MRKKMDSKTAQSATMEIFQRLYFIVRSLLEIMMLYHLSKDIDELLLILGRRIYGRGNARETLTSNISIDSQNRVEREQLSRSYTLKYF